MIIECPACKARAKLPESKEGAKVRCSECSRVYVARPAGSARGAARQSSQDPTKYIIGGLAVLGGLGIFLMTRGKGTKPAPPVVEAKEEAPPKVHETGWNAPAVQFAVKLHEQAHERNQVLLGASLAGEHLWKQVQEAKRAAGEEASDLPWVAVTGSKRKIFVDDLALDMIEGPGADLVGNWSPFDGSVLSSDQWEQDYHELVGPGQEVTVVRLNVAPRDLSSGLGNRWVEWAIARIGSQQKAVSWKRWISPEELDSGRKKRSKKAVKRELSDGSVVIESTLRSIPYEDTIEPELREEIDGLIAELIGLESKPFPIQQRLTEIGKPAIPPLLSKLAEIPLETETQAIQLNLVCQSLYEITGYQTTFKVSELLGTTRERQESGLMQWFGWYDRKFRRFGTRPEEEYVDEFADDPSFRPRSSREKRTIERAKRELEDG